jgi:glutathione S-transferase
VPIDSEVPVLWHIELSHFNEKVRWALDHKRIAHRRRPLLPGVHVATVRRLTGGTCATTPVLAIAGTAIGESAAIVAELERRWPEPPLYPSDPAQRARALELEALCDRELGPHVRRAAYEHLLARPDLLRPSFLHDQPPAARALFTAAFPAIRVGMRRYLRISAEEAAASRTRILAAVERLETELGDGDYLVGDTFSIADVAAASLLYLIARPPTFPYPIPPVPPGGAAFVDDLAQRRIGRWVALMYERHRAAPGVRRTLRAGGGHRRS